MILARCVALRFARLVISVPTRIFEAAFWVCASWTASLDTRIENEKACR